MHLDLIYFLGGINSETAPVYGRRNSKELLGIAPASKPGLTSKTEEPYLSGNKALNPTTVV